MSAKKNPKEDKMGKGASTGAVLGAPPSQFNPCFCSGMPPPHHLSSRKMDCRSDHPPLPISLPFPVRDELKTAAASLRGSGTYLKAVLYQCWLFGIVRTNRGFRVKDVFHTRFPLGKLY
ncbi:hypothetical protein CDAR_483631 [Caerostris darwini]|uniref:Uncharacterized protein n=1 Tax=Caerostris darwini TaxID=1538125 RepID=A0AAV4TNU2_9ARAC|nr:hypothetical protein CDAR_483631 [Caerostris darwini]